MTTHADRTRQHREKADARAFGFLSLFLWTSLGFALEAAHAFKLSSYLDQPQKRELLVWGHAHGVGLALTLLVYAALGAELPTRHAGKLLRFGASAMPLGFVLSIFYTSESDPGPAIWLVPVGALCLLLGLLELTLAAHSEARATRA